MSFEERSSHTFTFSNGYNRQISVEASSNGTVEIEIQEPGNGPQFDTGTVRTSFRFEDVDQFKAFMKKMNAISDLMGS